MIAYFSPNLGAKIRSQLPDFFIQVIKNKIQNSDASFVIEDIRFPEELEFCRSHATTIRLEIPFDHPVINLGERGLTEQDAIRVIECDDEKFLDCKAGWDFVVPAVGKFEDVAIQLNTLAKECY